MWFETGGKKNEIWNMGEKEWDFDHWVEEWDLEHGAERDEISDTDLKNEI